MVDIRRIDKVTSQLYSNTAVAYSDFYTNFNKHPETGALGLNTNVQAVKRALRNLLMTDVGERMFQPNYGCNIRKVLFEEVSAVNTTLLKSHIQDAIANYEPRVRVQEIVVVANQDAHSYEIAIVFQVINNTNIATLNLTLKRVR